MTGPHYPKLLISWKLLISICTIRPYLIRASRTLRKTMTLLWPIKKLTIKVKNVWHIRTESTSVMELAMVTWISSHISRCQRGRKSTFIMNSPKKSPSTKAKKSLLTLKMGEMQLNPEASTKKETYVQKSYLIITDKGICKMAEQQRGLISFETTKSMKWLKKRSSGLI